MDKRKSHLLHLLILAAGALTLSADIPPTEAGTSYPIVCRGGHPLGVRIETELGRRPSDRNLIQYSFNRTSTKQPASRLPVGACSWRDRAVRSNEPSVIKLYVGEGVTKFTGEQFAACLRDRNCRLQASVGRVGSALHVNLVLPVTVGIY